MKFTFNENIWAGWMLCQYEDPKIAPYKKYRKSVRIPFIGAWIFYNQKKF